MSIPSRLWSLSRRKKENPSNETKYRILELGRPIPVTDRVFFTHVVQYRRNGGWGYESYAKPFEEAVAYITEKHAQEDSAADDKVVYTE